MSVTVTEVLAGPFYPNGETTHFPFRFKVPSTSEVRVVSLATGSSVELDPGLYSVAIAADSEGGAVSFSVPPAIGVGPIYVEAAPSFQQLSAFSNAGFLPKSLNPNFDRAAMRDLWLKSRLDRGYSLPFGETGQELPPAAERAGKAFFWDGDGRPIPLPVTDAGGLDTLGALLGPGGFMLVKHKRSEAGTFARTAAQMEAAGMLGAPGLSVMHWVDPDFDEAVRTGALTHAAANLSPAFNAALSAALALNAPVAGAPGKFPLGRTYSEACVIMPPGSSLHGVRGMEVFLDRDDPSLGATAFIMQGYNALTGHGVIDGRMLLPGQDVAVLANWLNDGLGNVKGRHGVRSYATAEFGANARGCVIEAGWTIRNTRYAVQTEGAKNWKIAPKCERSLFSGILMGASTDRSCTGNVIYVNGSEDLGDYAAAFYELVGNLNGESAYNWIYGHAARCQLITNGHAVGWELGGQLALQHSNLIGPFVYERGRPDITFNRGVAVMGTCLNSRIVDVVGRGEREASSADAAIAVIGCQDTTVAGFDISRYSGPALLIDSSKGGVSFSGRATDCGKPGISPVMISQNGGKGITGDVRVRTTASFNGATATQPTVYGYLTAPGQTLDDVSIDVTLDRPVGAGAAVLGYDANNLATNVDIRVKAIGYASGEPADTFFEYFAVIARYIDGVRIDGRIHNAKYGIYARDCKRLTLDDALEFTGTENLLVAAWLSGSTEVRSGKVTIRCPVSSLLNGDTPASLSPGGGVPNSWFGRDNALFPPVNADSDAAAGAAGVVVGMDYLNAGAWRRKVA